MKNILLHCKNYLVLVLFFSLLFSVEAISIQSIKRIHKRSESRKLHSPTADTLDVKALGATGDGQTDDTEALRQIFQNAKSGQVIFFPAGTYNLSGEILIRQQGLTLFGAGDASIIRFTNSNDLNAQYGRRTGMINLYNDDITLHDLTFDQNFRNSGRKDGDNSLAGCVLIGGSYTGKTKATNHITVEHCTFYDYYGDALCAFQATCNDFTARDNHFVSAYIAGGWHAAGVKGEQAISIASGDQLIIENNRIDGALDDAIALHSRISNASIRNNEISTTGGRIIVCGANHVQVENNTIHYLENGPSAIMISFSNNAKQLVFNDDISVKGNKIFFESGAFAQQAIRLFGAGSNVVVSDNEIVFTDIKGIGIEMGDRKYVPDSQFYAGDHILIENNTIRNATIGIKETLVKTAYGNDCRIQHNHLIQSDLGVSAAETRIGDNNFESCAREKGGVTSRQQ